MPSHGKIHGGGILADQMPDLGAEFGRVERSGVCRLEAEQRKVADIPSVSTITSEAPRHSFCFGAPPT